MDHVMGWLFLGFWVVLGAAIVVRLVLALRRRRGSSLRDSVLRPVLSAGTVGVWPTADTRTSEHLEHVHGGAQDRTEASLVEPWPDAPRKSTGPRPEEASEPETPESPEPRDRTEDQSRE